MQTLFYWVLAARPFTLLISLTTIMVASALAYNSGIFNGKTFLLTALVTLLLQLLSNFANDLGDYLQGTDKTRTIGPDRMLQKQYISIRAMIIALILTVIFTMLIGSLLLYDIYQRQGLVHALFFLSLGIIAIIAAITYTVGKHPYGYYGLGDCVAFLFFGPVAICAMVYLHDSSLDKSVLLPALAVGFLTASVLNINNLRDINNDKISGKRTLAVLLGEHYGRMYHFGLNLAALACFARYSYDNPHSGALYSNLIGLIIFLGLFRHLCRITTHQNLQPFLLTTIVYNFCISAIFTLCLIL